MRKAIDPPVAGEDAAFDERVERLLCVACAEFGELGAQTAGIRSFADRRLLVSWDLLFVGRGGQRKA